MECAEIFTREFDAIRLILDARLVVPALAGFDVELITGDIGEIDLLGIFINQLVQTATTAPIA